MHRVGRYECPYCGDGFNSEATLSGHAGKHSGEGTTYYFCSKCGTRFNSLTKLEEHEDDHRKWEETIQNSLDDEKR